MIARDGDEEWCLLMIVPVTAWQQARRRALIISGNNNSNTQALIEWKRPLAGSLPLRSSVGELEIKKEDGRGGSDGKVARNKVKKETLEKEK